MNIKPGKPLKSKDRKLLVALGLFLFALFSLLIAQFYRIQIIEGDKWIKEANRQHILVVNEPFKRGTFYSNTSIKKGNPETPQKFTSDIQKFHLYIDPESIPVKHRAPMAKFLLNVLDLTAMEQSHFKAHFVRKSRSRKLAMWLDRDTRDTITKWWFPYAKKHKIARNALFFVSDYQRSYPFGKLLGQVLHTVQNNKDEASQQAVPTGGLELRFHNLLKGKQGKRRLMRSPRNAIETGEIIALPEHGADIYLTINHYIQAIAEEELAIGVKKCKAKSGWAVMMNPRTGEILAMAQYPFFHPPEYQFYFNDPEMIEHTKVKAITDANEPGSVMKPITLAVGLLANEERKKQGKPPILDPEEKVATADGHCKGRKNLKDGVVHPFLNMYMGLQKSSNIYMARLVEKIVENMGNEWYRRILEEVFALGKKTGVELPSESAGVLPTPGKKHPNGTLEWSVPTPYSLAIGHNMQVTSLQIARLYCIFANGGYLVKPTLVRKIIKTHPDGKEEVFVDNTSPEREKSFPRVLPAKNVETVVKAMKFTTKPGGSAKRADIWGYTEAGKTGTGVKIDKGIYNERLNSSSFVGFAPADDPVFVLVVTMDEPEYHFIPGIGKNHHGGVCAAPVFREIGRRTLEYLGITPDDPHGYPPGDPRYDPEKADWIPETRRLQEMYEKWNKSAEKI